ncbi:hypothetical protein MPTK1_7g03890 [Marchantia polymorpha subsp. ruderalis]|uniref:Uncharacterized protein n=2 Tax=Marchantia polymorpha TaxID=3197 RepID=A0AAF6BVX1_MARPO|nr:hypothetical protein MARPO_0074s0010 [Marchantia polymorpha]BBN16155.1 hypothetical protein Mp_7g03890 [Marchantia polymorpha subsp. ruderalis]|eukprot:PTQ35012.1 hypothetical protein MARPO_0074s0010 [Marchantia polymorpha]
MGRDLELELRETGTGGDRRAGGERGPPNLTGEEAAGGRKGERERRRGRRRAQQRAPIACVRLPAATARARERGRGREGPWQGGEGGSFRRGGLGKSRECS